MPRKLAFLVLGIFLYSIFSPPIFALSVSINKYPEKVVAGDEFEVEAELIGMQNNTDYFIKSAGGDNNEKVKTFSFINGEWLTYRRDWDLMPKFSISTGSSILFKIKSQFYEDIENRQNYYLKVRSPLVSSEIVQIEVSLPTLTPTLANTPTVTTAQSSPTNTPTSTKTPTPSKTPTPKKTPTPSKTPTPTKKLSPSPTKKTTITPTRKITKTSKNNTGEVLGKEINASTNSSFINRQSDDFVQILVLIGVLFGAASVAAYFYNKFQAPIDKFFRRKFKKE